MGKLQTLFEECKVEGSLVDLVGIEPTTSSMPWKRAPSCATGPLFGGRLSAEFEEPKKHCR